MNSKPQKIKCIVWDLDNTLWDGVLLEDEEVKLRSNVLNIIIELDKRGIIHSIASKNDYATAMQKLKEFDIEQYFLYPQINWNAKSESIKTISQALNMGLNTFAFIDDLLFELNEVQSELPEVLLINAEHVSDLLTKEEFIPNFITEDSKLRRQMYLNDFKRNQVEREYCGPKEGFLASLCMKFAIKEAELEDLQRVEELTLRTHQLNTTGYTYSYNELCNLIHSDKHKILVSSLEDKFGTYGKIGIALIQCEEKVWTIKLLLMSCRVMSRGVGSILINYIINLARQAKVELQAEFIHNNVNRMMYVTYKFSGFEEIEQKNGVSLLAYDFNQQNGYPKYIELKIN